MDGPQGKLVYIAGKSADGKDVALQRPVTVGEWVDLGGQPQWIIDQGLAAGDVVIVEGMAKIFPVPGGAPIMLGPPPGREGKGEPRAAAKDSAPAQTK